MEDLKRQGYIRKWEKIEKSQNYILTKPAKREFLVPRKTKEDKVESRVLLNSLTYTPDFRIYWLPKALGIFVHKLQGKDKKVGRFLCSNKLISVVEIKADHDYKNMTVAVIPKIKMLWAVHGVYTDLVKVPKLFRDTFTPSRYRRTDQLKQLRRIKYPNPLSLKEYVDKLG